jgi:hypothetical protein
MVVNGTSALLGVAGSVTATVVSGWIAPVLVCASVLLLSRSFFVIYVRKVRTRMTVVVAWSALTFMVSYWTWVLVTGGFGSPTP